MKKILASLGLVFLGCPVFATDYTVHERWTFDKANSKLTTGTQLFTVTGIRRNTANRAMRTFANGGVTTLPMAQGSVGSSATPGKVVTLDTALDASRVAFATNTVADDGKTDYIAVVSGAVTSGGPGGDCHNPGGSPYCWDHAYQFIPGPNICIPTGGQIDEGGTVLTSSGSCPAPYVTHHNGYTYANY